MARHNAVNESVGEANLSWRDKSKVPNEYVAYSHKFTEGLVKFENIWQDTHGSIKAAQN